MDEVVQRRKQGFRFPCGRANKEKAINKAHIEHALSLLPERYEFRQLLSQNGCGIIFSCNDKAAKRQVAIKTCIRGVQPDLQVECEVMKAGKSCEHLVKQYEYTTVNDTEYLVMQHLGENLSKQLLSQPMRRYSQMKTTEIAIDLVSAVRELHEIGYVHNNIKPSNFAFGQFPDGHGKLYLFDYSLCRRRFGYHPPPSQWSPRNNKMRSSLQYSSIAAQMRKNCTVWDDLESVLYTLVELFSGSLPWSNLTGARAILQCKRNFTVDNFIRGKFEPLSQLEQYIKFRDRRATPDYDVIIKYFNDYHEKLMKQYDLVWDGIFTEEEQK
ncbi:Pkinase domain containing protein [Trichuris trichiura]|uniref:Pkinase domain containing protein n=1 Tax=Trichuris trichiura TaxID=36087 RepID=A0A077ZCX5_TRITR|nr:Pkinase domain containing protein [Trichuris trichiura]